MAAACCACPQCARPLKMPPADGLPARVKCAQCAARFVVNRDGSTTVEAQPTAAAQAGAPPASSTPLVVGLAVAGVLLLGGGIALAVIAFSGGNETPRADAGHKEDGAGLANPANRLAAEPPRPEAAPQRPPPDPKVKAAIDRGVAFLKQALAGEQGREGGHVCGPTALAGLSLLSCGVPASDPAVVKAVELVRSQVGRLHQTYDLAICVWFLDKLNDPRDREAIQSVALRLIASQGVNGGWNYASYPLEPMRQSQLLALLQSPPLQIEDEKIEQPAEKPKEPARTNKGGKKAKSGMKPARRIPEIDQIRAALQRLPAMRFQRGRPFVVQPPKGHEDNSLTQFAILALWAAQKHGVPADRSLAFAETRFRASQHPNGGWAYGLNMRWRPRPSMTCAGLLGLAVGRGVRGDVKLVDGKKQALTRDPAVARALAFLGKEIDITDKPGRRRGKPGRRRVPIVAAEDQGGLYFLWSLERVGVVYNLDQIEGQDWYAWGSKLIVAVQKPDGSWPDNYHGLVDTSFALLFLNRVNVVADLTSKLQKLEPPTE